MSISNRLPWILCLLLAIQTVAVLARFTDVPLPPERPTHFASREALKLYLQRVHEYYAIISQPRFGRALVPTRISSQDLVVVDDDDAPLVSYDGWHDRLRD